MGRQNKLAFYDLSKEQRAQKVAKIQSCIRNEISKNQSDFCLQCFADADSYIRKAACLGIGRIFVGNESCRRMSSRH